MTLRLKREGQFSETLYPNIMKTSNCAHQRWKSRFYEKKKKIFSTGDKNVTDSPNPTHSQVWQQVLYEDRWGEEGWACFSLQTE